MTIPQDEQIRIAGILLNVKLGDSCECRGQARIHQARNMKQQNLKQENIKQEGTKKEPVKVTC